MIFLLSQLSCSVLEDRDECPCRLRIDLSGIPYPEVVLSLSLPDGSWQEERVLTLPRAEVLEVPVPKGKVDVVAVYPGTPGSLSRSGWAIPLGEDCPPLYLGAVRVNTSREEADCRVVVHKSFCRLTFRLAAESAEPFPFRLSVKGNVAGFSLSGAPRDGPFQVVLPPFDGAGAATVSLPRQLDRSLVLEILFTDDVLRSFALGELMGRMGYDWSAPDLEDAELTLDYARTLLTLCTGAWEESVYFEKVF